MRMTKQLLANPEINHSGVEHSIVFAALSEEQRMQIANASTEAEKLALSCELGEQSDLIGELYREQIEAPAQRVAQSYPYPHFGRIEKSFYMLFLTDEQREYVKKLDSEKQKQMAVKNFLSEFMNRTDS